MGPLLFLLYLNYLPQAVVSNSLLYADDTCIVFQHKSIIEIEMQLIRDYKNIYYKNMYLVFQRLTQTLSNIQGRAGSLGSV